jgi:hypothetical protein
MPVQPGAHARGLALTPGRQAALQVVQVAFTFYCLCVPP